MTTPAQAPISKVVLALIKNLRQVNVFHKQIPISCLQIGIELVTIRHGGPLFPTDHRALPNLDFFACYLGHRILTWFYRTV